MIGRSLGDDPEVLFVILSLAVVDHEEQAGVWENGCRVLLANVLGNRGRNEFEQWWCFAVSDAYDSGFELAVSPA